MYSRRLFLALALPVLVMGCGGGGVGSATGRATVRVTWPEESRLIPRASQSLEVIVRDEQGLVVGTAVLNRPVSSTTISPLPTGNLTASARAFPQAGAVGVPQAQASAPLAIQANTDTNLGLTLASTIARVGVIPASSIVLAQTTRAFTATAYDAAEQVVLTAPSGFTWSLSAGTDFAQIDAVTGVLTGTTAGVARVRATEPESSVFGEVDATINPAPIVTVTPAAATVFLDGTQTFSANVSQGVGNGVSWSVAPGSGGTITMGGLFTPSATPGTYSVVATSTVDSRWIGSATVTVPTPIVVFTQTVASVGVGRTATFTARIDNLSDQGITWSVREAGGGSITASGVYTAPATRGTYTIVATSTRDSRFKAEFSIRATAGTGVIIVQ
ncbi:MAG: hypothetical protein QM758_12640 [Armatimonas sp.]